MKHHRLIGIPAFAAASLIFAALRASASDPVPSSYAGLYQQLQTPLNAFEATLDGKLPPQSRHVVFATELLAANCNRGEALLQPATMDSVRLCLDRFRELGISGVTVAIHYPLFDPAFPRRDEYVAFYKTVAQEVHSRGMTLDVEENVIFAGTPFSPVQWDWSHYTVDSLAAARRAMAQIILDDVKPDYLNEGTESDTEAGLTGLSSLNDPQVFAGFIHETLDGLNRGETKLCAGMGAWDDIRQGELLAQEPLLDALAFHFYPLDPASLQNALKLGDLAKANGKRFILDECWLYKEPPALATVSSTDPYRRNTYSFWAPLDQQFLRCMAKLVQVDGVEFVSPYTSGVFFAYLTYGPSLDTMPFDDEVTLANQAQSAAIHAGTHTSTGDAYAALIAANPSALAASFSFDPAAPTDATSVAFTASASGGTQPYTYAWDLCGASATGESVTEALPAGTCSVKLTATDAAGLTATATQSVTVGYSIAISGASWASDPSRLKVSGSGFEPGCRVEIDGAAAPQTAYKSGGLLIAKGGGLSAMIPKGVTVQVTVVSADGRSSAPYPFAR